MDNWNPLKEDFNNSNFNSYNKGPGRHLPQGGTNKEVQLYVTGIPISLTHEAVRNLFLQCGRVTHVKILQSKIEGSNDTFGFITMGSLKEATEAITKLNNFQIDRFRLKVQASQSPEERDRRRRKREEDEAFLNTLNCAKNQQKIPHEEDSDDDITVKKSEKENAFVGIKNKPMALEVEIPKTNLSGLDDSIIRQGPPSIKVVSDASSLSDLTIVVNNQKRHVKNQYGGGKGRGHISGGKQCLYCCKRAFSLCTRCKMPYCGVECQTADWPKHKKSCGQISVMPKDLEDADFDVSIGEDIYRYLPDEERKIIKSEYGDKLKSSYSKMSNSIQSETRPVGSSPKPDKQLKSSAQQQNIGTSAANMSRKKLFAKDLVKAVSKLRVGEQFNLLLVVAASPEDFKVQINESTNQSTLAAFTTELDRKCQEQHKKFYRPEVGELVSCLYQDNHWYRGEVLRVTNASAVVYFLDYGDISETIFSDIQPLSVSQMEYPAQAIKCCLNGIKDIRLINIQVVDEKFSELSFQVQCKYRASVVKILADVVLLDLFDNKNRNVKDILKECVVSEKLETATIPLSIKSPSSIGKPIHSIPPSDFPASGSEVPSTFSTFLSDKEFCVSKADTFPMLCELVQLVNQECQADTKAYSPSVGEFVCALFENIWYRAKVLKEQNGKYTLLYVDFGNTSNVAKEEIRKIKTEFLDLPIQAIKCSFKGLNASLDENYRSTLEGQFQTGFNIKVVSVENDVHNVILTLKDGTNVNDVLIQALQGATTESQPSADKVTNLQIQPCDFPIDGSEVSSVFSTFLSGEEFCVSKAETFPILTDLTVEVNEYCHANTEAYAPSLNEYVCALYQNIWYRAKTMNITNEEFTVLYVDFGNTSNVPKTEIRKIKTGFLDLPIQAIKCSFKGLNASLDENYRSTLEGQFQTGFNIKVVSVENGVHNVILTLEDGTNVNDVLIQALQGAASEETPASLENVSTSLQIPPCDFPIDGSEVSSVFLTFLSGQEFCVSKAETLPIFAEFIQLINEYCLANTDSYTPNIGEYVCALFENGWFRAKVLDKNGASFTVIYVDYGNTRDVSIKEIRKMESRFAEWPSQAIRCTFKGLDVSIDENHRPALVETFKKGFNIKVVSVENGVHNVILTLEDGTNINDILIQSLQGATAAESTATPSEPTVPSNLQIQPCNFPIDGTEVSSVFSTFLPDKQFCVSNADTFPMLCELVQLVNQECQADTEAYSPSVGEFVCALYENIWYRAKVLNEQNGKYTLLYVDFGNTSIVAKEEIRKIKTVFLDLPIQAIKCTFKGLDASIEENHRSTLQETFQNGFNIKVASVENGVHNVIMTLEDGTNINDILIDAVQGPTTTESTATPSESTVPSNLQISPCDFPIDGTEVSSVFSTFLSDKQFSVSKADTFPMLCELVRLVNQECQADTKAYSPSVGEFVCALFENIWYRAKVLNEQNGKYTLLYVDFGNTSIVAKEEIRKIQTVFLDLPIQAIKCTFKGLNASTDENQRFTLQETFQNGFNIKVASVENGVHNVIMTLKDGTNINDILIDAVQGPTTTESTATPSESTVPSNLQIQPIQLIEKCPKEEPLPSTSSKPNFNIKDLKFVIPSDSELTVIFTHVLDPDNVYCHSAIEGSAEAMIELSNLCKDIADYCERSIMDQEPQVDHLYCGLMGEDWYRCVVCEILPDDKVLVQFVDIGESREVFVRNLRPFLAEFMKLPVYTFKCAVNGIKPIGEKWGTDAARIIMSFAGDKNFLTICRRESTLLYCDMKTVHGVNIKDELIKQCLAVSCIPEPSEDDEEAIILRQIAELQAKLANKVKLSKT